MALPNWNHRRVILPIMLVLQAISSPAAEPPRPIVEIEEDLYSYTSAQNGAGPMWCAGSTSIFSLNGRTFAAGLETVSDAQPLNNCRWTLFERGSDGWKRVFEDAGRTREPSPIAGFHDGQLFVSGNPTLGTGAEPNGGPARPELVRFRIGSDPSPNGPERILPEWAGAPGFSEHSYRSLAADGAAGELVLFQNIGYTHAEWAFRDRAGGWPAQGRLSWPRDEREGSSTPVRLCYPNVAVQDRAVHFFGIGDIVEPNEAWRREKQRLSGRQWDYVFRRLFYTWTDDITENPFRSWIEIANRESTAGHLWPCDMWLAPDGAVHLLWTDQALDGRLRTKFFPDAAQSHSLEYSVLRTGKTVLRRTLIESTEDTPGLTPGRARFHITPDNRLFVVAHVSGADTDGKQIAENRVAEIGAGESRLQWTRLPLEKPFANFFSATPRAGSPKSNHLHLLGPRAGGSPNTMGYARIRLF